ncbi:ATP-binding protein [Cribrihabitans pelagius]|uniref:ATP-binding protein n=1 Tax=Cribrihabitans pelagius TaxID=1765746 RepID=UPI003B594234
MARSLYNRTYLPALLAFAVVCAASYFADRQNATIHHQNHRADVQYEAGIIRSHLEGRMNADNQLLQGLAAVMSTEPGMSQDRFAELVSRVVDGVSEIRNVAAAPDLVVALVHPIEGNEAVLGLDYNKNAAQRSAAYEVRDSGSMVLAGPVNLLQGGRGFIYRLPIFTGKGPERRFWGLLSAVVDVETLYANAHLTAPQTNIEVALVGKDGAGAEGELFHGSRAVLEDDPVLMDIHLPQGSWQLAARPRGGWSEPPPNLWHLRLALLAAGALIVFPTFLAGRLSAARQSAIGTLRRREHELDAVTRRLEVAVKTSRIGIWEFNASQNQLIWDARMRELYGLPRDGGLVQFTEWLERLHPADRDRVVSAFQAAMSERTHFSADFRIVADDGSEKHIRALASPFTDGAGQHWMIGVNWNVSEDVRLREALIRINQTLSQRNAQLNEGKLALEKAHADLQANQDELHRLSLVAKHASDSIVLSGPDRRILWVNDSFTRLTGYSAEEAIGAKPGDLLDGPKTDPAIIRDIERHKSLGRPYHAEMITYSKSGEERWFDTNIVPVMGGDGTLDLVIGIERDITQARARADELAEAKLAAEQADRAKTEFLANMSHEIRTPMNGIIGMADLLAEAPLDEDNRQNVETIRSSSQALLKIINDILDLSRLEAGKLAFAPVDFDLRDCIGGTVNLLQPKAAEKGLALRVSYAPDLPAHLHGDDGRLRQILVNLIGNSVKFTSTGTVSVRVARAGDDPFRLQIEVEDTGIGISEQQARHIFDRFTQADTATTRAFGGTGLGLTISRLLAERMQGRISVQSAPGEGACFRLEVQMAPPQQGAETPGAHACPPTAPLEDCLVLLAEDNRTNRLLIRKYLRDQPVRLVEAENGRRAADLCRELKPDIILMDMSMPELDGIAATREIRGMPIPQPAIVALTANAFSSDREACLAAGMDHFLAKPVNKTVLLQTLTRVQSDWAKPRAIAMRAT